MKLFVDDLRTLTDENIIQLRSMQPQNRKCINSMIRYLQASSLSLFEVQVIQKDLIGMAREAEVEQVPLENRLGMTEKEFCNEVIANDGRHARWEHVMEAAVWALQVFTVFYLCGFAMYRFPVEFGIALVDILILVLLLIWKYIENKLSLERGLGRKYIPFVYTGFILLGGGLCIIIPLDHFIISGNGWVILSVVLVFTSAATIGRKRYWGKCSKKYNWKS